MHFAANEKHIGFNLGAHGIEAFKTELAPFHLSKGAVQLPLDKPLPIGLVSKIVKERVKQNPGIIP